MNKSEELKREKLLCRKQTNGLCVCFDAVSVQKNLNSKQYLRAAVAADASLFTRMSVWSTWRMILSKIAHTMCVCVCVFFHGIFFFVDRDFLNLRPREHAIVMAVARRLCIDRIFKHMLARTHAFYYALRNVDYEPIELGSCCDKHSNKSLAIYTLFLFLFSLSFSLLQLAFGFFPQFNPDPTCLSPFIWMNEMFAMPTNIMCIIFPKISYT